MRQPRDSAIYRRGRDRCTYDARSTEVTVIDPPPETLPDLLRDGLDIVFVGINPGLYSAQRGHYFARRTNRFWPALSRSVLSRAARRGLGVAELLP